MHTPTETQQTFLNFCCLEQPKDYIQSSKNVEYCSISCIQLNIWSFWNCYFVESYLSGQSRQKNILFPVTVKDIAHSDHIFISCSKWISYIVPADPQPPPSVNTDNVHILTSAKLCSDDWIGWKYNKKEGGWWKKT